MVRATTPTFQLTIPDNIDLTAADRIIFTLSQDRYRIDKEGDDLIVENNTVWVYLSQAETLQLNVGTARIQLNWTYPSGKRACSDIVKVNITDNLFNEVM